MKKTRLDYTDFPYPGTSFGWQRNVSHLIRRFSMHKLNWMLLTIFLANSLSACAPVATPVQVIPTTVEVAAEPAYGLHLLPLDDSRVASDLATLTQLQSARTPEDISLILKWHSHPVVTWNEQTRYWVAYYGMDPVVATRLYAMISVAQQRALDALALAGVDFVSRRPRQLESGIEPVKISSDPFESAVLIGATEPVFLLLLTETEDLSRSMTEEARHALLMSGNILPSDLQAAEDFGRVVAEGIIQERMNDGSADAKKFDPLPIGESIWKPDPFRVRPEQPGWGKVTPWLMSTGDQFRAPPPPAFDSLAFQSALEEVYEVQIAITHDQMAIAQKWADKRFTSTPPGHWNLIAANLIIKYGLSDREAAHLFSALNMAVMDAGIACWDTKYHYLIIRPWQVDTRISSLVGYPNHPSYPSGHSCFSAASAETLAYFFPAERESLWQMAEEASISRLYGGIHYRFDMEAGQQIGRQIGGLAQEFAITQTWSPFVP